MHLYAVVCSCMQLCAVFSMTAIDSHVNYTYKHRYHCLHIEYVNMFVDDVKHSRIELSVPPQKVRFVRRMLLFTRHPNLASATPPPKVKRLIIQNTNAEGYVCSITQRTQGD